MRTIALFASLAASALAQNAAPPAFEVASVKISSIYRPDDRSTWYSTVNKEPGAMTMRNVGLQRIIATAYAVQIPLVAGPAWMDSQRYEVLAKAGRPASEKEMEPMLRTLLGERFKLEVHREKRQMQVMAILQPKSGHKMTPTKNQGPTRSSQDPVRGSIIEGAGLPALADELARELNIPVVDLTGLTGRFDFAFNPQKYVASMRARFAADPNHPPESELQISVLQDLFTGDLGLQLEKRKMEVEVLVIDRCEKTPSEN